MGDNFNICCRSDVSNKVWTAYPNFGNTITGLNLGIGERTFTGRVKMMVYYDRANKKIWAKNLTNVYSSTRLRIRQSSTILCESWNTYEIAMQKYGKSSNQCTLSRIFEFRN